MDYIDQKFLTISEVERLTGVSSYTLRLWERYELITPVRGKNNYRFYTPLDLQRTKDIVRLRYMERLPLNAIRSALSQNSDAVPPGIVPEETAPEKPIHQLAATNRRSVGWKLKALRREMGLSLREAAARTGLTPSHISVVESTSTGGSYKTLSKLARCYGTTMHDLNRIEPDSQDIQIVRGRGRLLPLYRQGLEIQQMAEGFLKMDVTKVHLDVGCSSGEEPYSHDGEEYIYVLKGQLEITLDGTSVYLLEENESVYFNSTHPHSWRNPGQTRTELLWINTVPSF